MPAPPRPTYAPPPVADSRQLCHPQATSRHPRTPRPPPAGRSRRRAAPACSPPTASRCVLRLRRAPPIALRDACPPLRPRILRPLGPSFPTPHSASANAAYHLATRPSPPSNLPRPLVACCSPRALQRLHRSLRTIYNHVRPRAAVRGAPPLEHTESQSHRHSRSTALKPSPSITLARAQRSSSVPPAPACGLHAYQSIPTYSQHTHAYVSDSARSPTRLGPIPVPPPPRAPTPRRGFPVGPATARLLPAPLPHYESLSPRASRHPRSATIDGEIRHATAAGESGRPDPTPGPLSNRPRARSRVRSEPDVKAVTRPSSLSPCIAHTTRATRRRPAPCTPFLPAATRYSRRIHAAGHTRQRPPLVLSLHRSPSSRPPPAGLPRGRHSSRLTLHPSRQPVHATHGEAPRERGIAHPAHTSPRKPPPLAPAALVHHTRVLAHHPSLASHAHIKAPLHSDHHGHRLTSRGPTTKHHDPARLRHRPLTRRRPPDAQPAPATIPPSGPQSGALTCARCARHDAPVCISGCAISTLHSSSTGTRTRHAPPQPLRQPRHPAPPPTHDAPIHARRGVKPPDPSPGRGPPLRPLVHIAAHSRSATHSQAPPTSPEITGTHAPRLADAPRTAPPPPHIAVRRQSQSRPSTRPRTTLPAHARPPQTCP
jgi:hypothetical protein